MHIKYKNHRIQTEVSAFGVHRDKQASRYSFGHILHKLVENIASRKDPCD